MDSCVPGGVPHRQAMVLLAPDHVPDQLGGSYEDGCTALGLEAAPGGFAIYLLDRWNLRRTLVSCDAAPARQALEDWRDGGDGLAQPSVASADLAALWENWPEEFGGGPRCGFCRGPAQWVYEGAKVEVLFGSGSIPGHPLPVVGSDVVGCIDWYACALCQELIDARTRGAWQALLDRYGDDDGEGVPMAVQSAWREFWGNHRPAEPVPEREWTPGLRRRTAYEITAGWEAFADARTDELAVLLAQPHTQDHQAEVRAAVQEARSYTGTPPPRGRIRIHRLPDGRALVRADGDGWTFIGAREPAGYVLLDSLPHTAAVIEPQKSAELCEGLARGNQ